MGKFRDMNTTQTDTPTAAEIAAAIHGQIPTAEASDRVVYVKPQFVNEVREMAELLGAAETQVSPSALFGTMVVTIWMD